jgi:signal transduction histidine kinase/ABC-type multidrug transport system ATPase subunit
VVAAVSSPPHDPMLRVEDVAVSFGQLRALDGVDLRIRPGELVGLAGENGAGKSTLVRCIAGDVAPSVGRIMVDGQRLAADPAAAAALGVAVVWQDLALCENLDVAANLLLGRERKRLLLSESRFHATAASMLDEIGIPLHDTTREARTLSGGQRQLLAVARALRNQPRLLLLDEPTASLGVMEAAQVEDLIVKLQMDGTTIVLASHDIEQMFRLADRIIVLRHGRVVADVDPVSSHADDVVALISGQQVDSSARRQLSRLNGLVDRLASSDPSSSLSLILSTLGPALGTDQVCIHLVDGSLLRLAGSLGLSPDAVSAWREVPLGPAGGPFGMAAATADVMIDADVRTSEAWRALPSGRVASSWAVPVAGSAGVMGVITLFGRIPGRPSRDEIDLVTLYAGYAASAVERDRLLGELTARNRVLETIREILETLAGPVPLARGLTLAVAALRDGLGAEEVGLFTQPDGGELTCRVRVGEEAAAPEDVATTAAQTLAAPGRDGKARRVSAETLAVGFPAPGGRAALVARWEAGGSTSAGSALLEDAAHSLRLALEREDAERAHQEATALRRTQELQQLFLSRLSHELRTPLTAIRGYASSLLQTDVTWDGESQQRFVSRISTESARLGRLVDDLLDFSAIESNTLRLQLDWCDLALVLDAARACLPPDRAEMVELRSAPELPAVWADHDRLEQVLVNLMDNALRHNPPGTRVCVSTAVDGAGVVITVADDGVGMPVDFLAGPLEPAPGRRSATSGAGLGLSIAKGIVDAHDGTIELERSPAGARFLIRLPIDDV